MYVDVSVDGEVPTLSLPCELLLDSFVYHEIVLILTNYRFILKVCLGRERGVWGVPIATSADSVRVTDFWGNSFWECWWLRTGGSASVQGFVVGSYLAHGSAFFFACLAIRRPRVGMIFVSVNISVGSVWFAKFSYPQCPYYEQELPSL